MRRNILALSIAAVVGRIACPVPVVAWHVVPEFNRAGRIPAIKWRG